MPLRDTYNQYLAYHEGKAGFARGSYRGKTWLPPVARDVEAWAALYEQQLQTCPPLRLTIRAPGAIALRCRSSGAGRWID